MKAYFIGGVADGQQMFVRDPPPPTMRQAYALGNYTRTINPDPGREPTQCYYHDYLMEPCMVPFDGETVAVYLFSREVNNA